VSASSASSGLSPCAWSRSPCGPVAHAVQVVPRMAGSAKPSSADDRANYGITPSLPMSGCNTKPAATPIPPRMSQPASLLGISSPATLFSRRATGPNVNPRTATLQGPLQRAQRPCIGPDRVYRDGQQVVSANLERGPWQRDNLCRGPLAFPVREGMEDRGQ